MHHLHSSELVDGLHQFLLTSFTVKGSVGTCIGHHLAQLSSRCLDDVSRSWLVLLCLDYLQNHVIQFSCTPFLSRLPITCTGVAPFPAMSSDKSLHCKHAVVSASPDNEIKRTVNMLLAHVMLISYASFTTRNAQVIT